MTNQSALLKIDELKIARSGSGDGVKVKSERLRGKRVKPGSQSVVRVVSLKFSES